MTIRKFEWGMNVMIFEVGTSVILELWLFKPKLHDLERINFISWQTRVNFIFVTSLRLTMNQRFQRPLISNGNGTK